MVGTPEWVNGESNSYLATPLVGTFVVNTLANSLNDGRLVRVVYSAGCWIRTHQDDFFESGAGMVWELLISHRWTTPGGFFEHELHQARGAMSQDSIIAYDPSVFGTTNIMTTYWLPQIDVNLETSRPPLGAGVVGTVAAQLNVFSVHPGSQQNNVQDQLAGWTSRLRALFIRP